MPTDDKKQQTAVTDTPPIIFAEDAIPPMTQSASMTSIAPAAQVTPNQQPTQTPNTDEQKQDVVTPTPVTSSGSAAPSDDVIMPPVITTITPPKKKFAGGKVIATILGLFLLVGGVGAGVFLTQQNQNINEKACGGDGEPACATNTAGITEVNNYNEIPQAALDAGCENGVCGNGTTGEYRVKANKTDATDSYIPGNCPSGTKPDLTQAPTCSVAPPNCCSNAPDGHVVYSWGEDHQDYYECVYPCVALASASCQKVQVYGGAETYTIDQTPLTSAQLAALKPGDGVRLCVTGQIDNGTSTTKQGPFDKAVFTINGVKQAELVSRDDPRDMGTFCQGYTLPAGVTTFNVTAEIHHPEFGWK